MKKRECARRQRGRDAGTAPMFLLQVMIENKVKNMVFSSSATVYGDPKYLPLDEKHPAGGCTNPYGKTKYFIEEILSDVQKADPVSADNRKFELYLRKHKRALKRDLESEYGTVIRGESNVGPP